MRAYKAGKSLREIAATVGWHHSRVHVYLLAAGVDMRPAGQGRPTAYELPAATIAEAYAGGTSLSDLAATYGCKTTSPIKRALAEAWRLRPTPAAAAEQGSDPAPRDTNGVAPAACAPTALAAAGGPR